MDCSVSSIIPMDITDGGRRAVDDAPTLEEIRGWPATVDVATGARALGYSRSWAYQLVAAGEFPVRVITVRGRSRVVTAALLALLDTQAPGAA
jgi:hypothetical protein